VSEIPDSDGYMSLFVPFFVISVTLDNLFPRTASIYGRSYPLAIQWNSEGITFILLQREIEEVRIQIGTESNKNHYGKHYKARAVVDYRKKGKQENPEDGIISLPNKGEWVSEPLFD
jgi:hypothetical protein